MSKPLTDDQRLHFNRGYEAGLAAATRAVLKRFPDLAPDLAVAIVRHVASQGANNVRTVLDKQLQPWRDPMLRTHDGTCCTLCRPDSE